MSRAFVKESDGDQPGDELPERPHSPHPNFVTPEGLALLQRELTRLQEERHRLTAGGEPEMLEKEHLKLVERDLRYVQERIDRAILVDPAKQPQDRVAFGATVTVIDDDDKTQRFTLVGEDEADPVKGKISWASPLGRALADAAVGDYVVWKRPAGDLGLEITAISYG